MTKEFIPRLCGGTFFVLVLQALRQRLKAKEHYKGDKDGLSDPEVLIGLIKVVNPDFKMPYGGPKAIKVKTNDFKSCKTSTGEYLPFGDTVEAEEFDKRVRENYAAVLSAMTEFVNQFLDLSPSLHKDERLVRALLDLIQRDDSIQPDDEFYILEDGGTVRRADLDETFTKVCFPAFLLGVWHFVVTYRKNNRIGEATYNLWCPSSGGAERTYRGTMGKKLPYDVFVYMPDPDFAHEENEAHAEETDDTVNEEDHGRDGERQKAAPQVMNNPVFIQQNGNDNMSITNYGTINLTLGGKK